MKMYGVLSEYGGLRMKKNGKRYARRKIQERNNWENDIQKMNPELVKTSSDIQDEEFLKESAEPWSASLENQPELQRSDFSNVIIGPKNGLGSL